MKIILNVLVVLFYFNTFADIPTTKDFTTSMQDEQIVGQLFMIGFQGKTWNSSLESKINSIMPGGLILFGHNIKTPYQVAKLNSGIIKHFQTNQYHKPFIAVDQEGGLVTRIKTQPKLPSALSLGKTNDPELVRNLSNYTGNLLQQTGFNMNLAPVLDIADMDGNDFIGSRAYGSNPNKVTTMSKAFIEGMNNSLVVSTAKHFPGHGGIKTDSHKELPVSDLTKKELLSKDLIPYLKLIEENYLPAIMIGHLAFPKIDSSMRPASFSKVIIDEILRKELKYKGLIITDDIEMKGANLEKSPGKRAISALNSGVDMIMVAWNVKSQNSAYEEVLKEYKKNQEFQKLINSKVNRILNVKKQFNILESKEAINRRELRKLLFDNDYKKNVSKVHQKSLALQIKPQTKELFSNNNKPIIFFSNYSSMFVNFSKSVKPKTMYFQLKKLKSGSKLVKILNSYPKSLVVYHISGKRSSNLLSQLPAKYHNRILVLNTAKPYLVQNQTDFIDVLQIATNEGILAKELGLQISESNRATASEAK